MAIPSQYVAVEAELLTPFFYHSIPTAGGSATLAGVLADTALNFALAATLGMMRGTLLPEHADYRADIGPMPFRFSAMQSQNAELLSAQVRRLNLDAEAGMSTKIRDGADKGNLKDFYRVQEVAPGAIYHGIIVGEDPFERTGQDELILRVGKHRQGLLMLKRSNSTEPVVINAYTAAVFDRKVPVSRYYLHTIQLSPPMAAELAAKEMAQWI